MNELQCLPFFHLNAEDFSEVFFEELQYREIFFDPFGDKIVTEPGDFRDDDLLQGYSPEIIQNQSLYYTVENYSSLIKGTEASDQLRVACINIASLPLHIDELESAVIDQSGYIIDVIGITEAKIPFGTEGIFSIPGYNLFTQSRIDRSGGCRCICSRQLIVSMFNTIEHLARVLGINNSRGEKWKKSF